MEEIKLEVDPNGHQDDEDSGPMDYQNEDSDTEFAPKEEDSGEKKTIYIKIFLVHYNTVLTILYNSIIHETHIFCCDHAF